MEPLQLNKSISIWRYLFLISLLLGLSNCSKPFFKNELSQILGVDKIEIKDVHIVTDEFAGFGKSYSMEIYDLSDNTIYTFINEPSKQLPDKKEIGKKWQKHLWSETAVDSGYNEIFGMALNYYNGDKKLENQLNEIKQLLGKTGVYYSFYYYPNKDNPNHVQLFVLDTEMKKFYAIDSCI